MGPGGRLGHQTIWRYADALRGTKLNDYGLKPWVGRTSRSAADAPVGLFGNEEFARLAQSGSRGTRADQGVRPTKVKPAESFRPESAYRVVPALERVAACQQSFNLRSD
jgi:hypothetical protein